MSIRSAAWASLRMLAALAVAVGVWPCWARTTSGPAISSPTWVEPPEYAHTTRVPETLIGPRRRQVLILPSEPGAPGEHSMQRSGGAIARLPADAHRLPEGYVVASRTARAERQGRWYAVHVEKVEGLPEAPPLRLLPNSRLAMLEAVLAHAGGPRRFVITGRVTEFQGANYLLTEDLAEVRSRDRARPAAAPVPPSAAGASPPGAEPGGSTRPAARHEPTAEQVIQQLMQQETRRAIVLPDQLPMVDSTPPVVTERDNSAVGPGNESPGWAEETLLIDRIGRVVPGESWWTFVFEDRGRNPKDGPIRLLPNQLLETAITLSEGGSRAVVFVISGEVTLYNGSNYLLLRKVLVRRDLGNFR